MDITRCTLWGDTVHRVSPVSLPNKQTKQTTIKINSHHCQGETSECRVAAIYYLKCSVCHKKLRQQESMTKKKSSQ